MIVKHYNDKSSWFAYQNTVSVTKQNVGTWNEDTDRENRYPAIVMKVADPDGEPWNTNVIEIFPNDGEIDENLDNYRNSERMDLTANSDDGVEFHIVYSLRSEVEIESAVNICRTVWVCIVLTIAAIHFSNATTKLVLSPLERMLEIVKKIAKDPSSAASQEEMKFAGIHAYLKSKNQKKQLDQNMETAILE